ncbi:universal stress protein [Muriicola sp. Z0-33]|uniref:universal stress protein n=1 Tax=Muriicola sp. Z0-33 TaxID=2816957 RepID=UPI002236F324|nr:universal stress protein [Muriicola sp. Z0-33]MCW5517140.1 universal stress protein [Muriicola sp. Z0-33]
MKTILYATDYSKNSVSALKLSYLLAKKFDAMLLLLHVFDTPPSLASSVSISHSKKKKELFIENLAKLKAFCMEHLGDDMQDVDCHLVVEENASSWSGILEKATQTRADLIVVGATGAGQLKELLMGSTTKALFRKSACAVLAIPADCDSLKFKTMVYASDFEQADIFALRSLVSMARKFDAQIRVVHIAPINEYKGEQQMEWFKNMVNQKVQYEKISYDQLISDSLTGALNGFLEDSGADLLAMLERQEKGAVSNLFHKDTVLKMENRIDIPLISYNVGGL